jgi:hypothetical protein
MHVADQGKWRNKMGKKEEKAAYLSYNLEKNHSEPRLTPTH